MYGILIDMSYRASGVRRCAPPDTNSLFERAGQ